MSKPREEGVLGVFAEIDAAVEAVERLKSAGLTRIVTFSPMPSHDLEHALHPPASPVRTVRGSTCPSTSTSTRCSAPWRRTALRGTSKTFGFSSLRLVVMPAGSCGVGAAVTSSGH